MASRLCGRAKHRAVFESMNKIVDNKFVALRHSAIAAAREFGRFVRFGITGVIATLAYAVVTIILVERWGVRPIPAAIVGYLAASGISYFGHLYFSFSVEPNHRTYLWRFLIVSALSFTLNIIITWIVTALFACSARVSVIIVSILIPATNYLCNRFWVFLPGLRLTETDAVLRPGAVKNNSDPV
jgi:putative flippase GtrA